MLDELKHELEQLSALGLQREFHPRLFRAKGRIQIRGQSLLDFTNWDIFNVGDESKVKRAQQTEIEQHGLGSGSARLISGTTPAHLSCEQRLARFLGTESSLLFTSLNQAVLSLVSALLGERDCLICDELSAAPMVDAAYLVNADVLNFSSDNPDTLSKLIEQVKPYRRKLLFLETISPVSGRRAALEQIAKIVSKTDIELVLDESSALGLIGERGAGLYEASRITEPTFALVGSLSKGIGSYGAFVAGSKILTNYLLSRSRSFVSENLLSAGAASATEAAISFVELQVPGRARLKQLALRLRHGLLPIGLNIDHSIDAPIVSIQFKKRIEAQELNQALFQRGYLSEVVSAGYALDETAMIRFLINIDHQEKEIDQLLGDLIELVSRVKR